MDFLNMILLQKKLNPKKMQRIFNQKDQAAEDFQELKISKRNEGQKHDTNEHRCVSISPDEKKQT